VLRLLFVLVIVLAGIYYSLQGAFYILLFYLWNAYFRPEEWVWSSVLYQLRLSLAIGSMLALASIPSLGQFRLSPETGLILLFLAQSTVSWLVSAYMALTTDYYVEFLKVIIITLLITVLVGDTKRFRLTLLVIAFSLGLEAAKQGWAQLVLNPGAPNNNTQVVLGDNNGVAMGMMMLVPVFMALAQTASTRWERYLHRFFLVGVLYRGISTYSRGGFLAAGTIGLITLLRSKHKIRGLIIVAVLSTVIATAMPQRFWDRMDTITAEGDERDASAQSRLYFWQLATQMAHDHPATGVGFNAFRFAFASYDQSGGSYGEIRAVHSVWFGVVSDLGYPGLVIFVTLIGMVLLRYWRIRRQAHARGLTEIGIYATNLQTSILAFVVGGTFLSAHYLELIWHFFGLSIALTRVYDHALAADVEPAATPLPARVVAAGAANPVEPILTPLQPQPHHTRRPGTHRFFDDPDAD
jgi:probable O-glycosylation ligase (exosortase A-associated)